MKNIFNKIKNFFKNVKEKFKSFVKKVVTKVDDICKNHGETVITGATVSSLAVITGAFLYWQKKVQTARINALPCHSPVYDNIRASKLFYRCDSPIISYESKIGTIEEFKNSWWVDISPMKPTQFKDIGSFMSTALEKSNISEDSPVENVFMLLNKPEIEVSSI